MNRAGLQMPETADSSLPHQAPGRTRVVLFANTDWYLYNFRLSLARRIRQGLDAEVWIACPDGPYRTTLEAEGFRWIPIALRRRSLNPWHDLAAAWKLAKALRRIQPHLLHAFTLKSILVGNLATWAAAVPRVVNAFTGLGSLYGGRRADYLLARKLLALFFRLFLGRAGARTIFQNPEDLAQVRALVGHSDSFRLIPGSGVDTRRFHPPEEPPGAVVVLLVSRLIRDKGIQAFCEAASLVHVDMPQVRFQVAGTVDPGNPSSFTQAEIDRLSKLHPMTEFLGQREDMPELFRGAALAVLPAQAREGLPRSLIEACASGLPLVASDVEGIREVLLHGQNGLLVPPGDVQALASAWIEILQDPLRRSAMGRASRALALEHFDQEKVLEATLAVYAELGLIPEVEGRP